MKKLYFAIIFALGLLQPCRGCAQNAQDSFYQFLGNFNILSTQDSVLTLQEIENLDLGDKNICNLIFEK